MSLGAGLDGQGQPSPFKLSQPKGSTHGLLPQAIAAVLLTCCAMFVRNLLLPAIFALESVPYACAPMLAMTLAVAYFVCGNTRAEYDEQSMDLKLSGIKYRELVCNFGIPYQFFGVS